MIFLFDLNIEKSFEIRKKLKISFKSLFIKICLFMKIAENDLEIF
jgi:hypothetical protein